jgi:hypothetical protein
MGSAFELIRESWQGEIKLQVIVKVKEGEEDLHESTSGRCRCKLLLWPWLPTRVFVFLAHSSPLGAVSCDNKFSLISCSFLYMVIWIWPNRWLGKQNTHKVRNLSYSWRLDTDHHRIQPHRHALISCSLALLLSLNILHSSLMMSRHLHIHSRLLHWVIRRFDVARPWRKRSRSSSRLRWGRLCKNKSNVIMHQLRACIFRSIELVKCLVKRTPRVIVRRAGNNETHVSPTGHSVKATFSLSFLLAFVSTHIPFLFTNPISHTNLQKPATQAATPSFSWHTWPIRPQFSWRTINLPKESAYIAWINWARQLLHWLTLSLSRSCAATVAASAHIAYSHCLILLSKVWAAVVFTSYSLWIRSIARKKTR